MFSCLNPFEIHCRLEHLFFSILKKLCPQLQLPSNLECKSCQFAKHYHLPSVARVNKRALSPFEFVHSNVWDLCPIISKHDFKYFITSIDEYSCVT